MQDLTEDDGAAGREAADGEDSDDDERHTAMLADIRGGDEAGRKRKRRDVVVSEAYPESEYNLNPVSATTGAAAGLVLLRRLGWDSAAHVSSCTLPDTQAR